MKDVIVEIYFKCSPYGHGLGLGSGLAECMKYYINSGENNHNINNNNGGSGEFYGCGKCACKALCQISPSMCKVCSEEQATTTALIEYKLESPQYIGKANNLSQV